ncbi:hypothetical protein HCX49_04430 [Sphingobacterium kitahiroshimense]|uniref:hypothetical protein n=1 Tax=Sphingobacterium sp. B16(2022) TaxID=2914044 RepID=UPI001439CAD6|nr:hypothetical protein [Sphingobacterium sp. B16(2022)]NJI72444.1 hypothetical protein [Sphingobacterium sp. B16(2022)]
MEKKEFTPEGVRVWYLEFYAQNDFQKKQQIQALQQSFRLTLKSMFYFTSEQEEWLDALDDDFIFVISNQLTLTLTLELPIRLVKPEKPGPGISVLGVKRGESHNPINSSAATGEALQAEGEFVFVISY